MSCPGDANDPRVRGWLFAVKDALFDAEDLLDEIDYELTKCEVEAESESKTFTHQMMTKKLSFIGRFLSHAAH